MKLAYWFSLHPVFMALSTLALAVILSGPAYLYFRRQAARRLGDQEIDA